MRTEHERAVDARYYKDVVKPKREEARRLRLAAGIPRKRRTTTPTEALMMRVPKALKDELAREAARRTAKTGRKVTLTDIALPRLETVQVPEPVVDAAVARAKAEGKDPHTFVTELLKRYASGG